MIDMMLFERKYVIGFELNINNYCRYLSYVS